MKANIISITPVEQANGKYLTGRLDIAEYVFIVILDCENEDGDLTRKCLFLGTDDLAFNSGDSETVYDEDTGVLLISQGIILDPLVGKTVDDVRTAIRSNVERGLDDGLYQDMDFEDFQNFKNILCEQMVITKSGSEKLINKIKEVATINELRFI